MQKGLGIGGVFFRAKDPQALSTWYKRHLGVDTLEKTWVQERGLTVS